MDKLFKRFVYQGVEYLAVRRTEGDSSVQIVEPDGRYHGAFRDIDSFKKYTRQGDTVIGYARLIVSYIPNSNDR